MNRSRKQSQRLLNPNPKSLLFQQKLLPRAGNAAVVAVAVAVAGVATAVGNRDRRRFCQSHPVWQRAKRRKRSSME